MSIADNIARIKSQLPPSVELVAVSKFHPVERLQQAIDAGQLLLGESRAQELAAKAPQLPQQVKWHFIGHLQTNKVRPVVAHATIIESIDSLRLLQAVEMEATRTSRQIDVLLQLHVAQEQTKTGFAIEELLTHATLQRLDNLSHVRIRGIMAMASLTDDNSQIQREFTLARNAFELLRDEFFAHQPLFDIVSMGMSDDWRIAVDCGSTMVRIGTAIFGPREY